MADNVLRFAVTLDDAGAIKGFKALKTAADQAGSTVGSSFGAKATGGLGKLEKGLKSAGGAMSHAKGQIMGLAGSVGLLAGVGGVAGLVGVMSQSVTAARDFGDAMDLVQTQAGASAAEVDAMTKGIVEMSRSVGTAPEELAKGIYHIESAGIRGAKALDILRIAAEGAKVGNADLESVTNAMIASVTSGVKGVTSMSQAMGTLNAIVGSGNMRMEDLTAALGTGILSTAKSFGVSIQGVGAALADMTNQGIPAVDAANAIRSAMRLMAVPAASGVKALKSIGLTGAQLAKDMRSSGGLLTAVQDLKDHMDKAGLSATEQAALLTKAFGGRQSQGILTLVGNIGKLKAATDSVAAGAGNFDAAWAKTEQDAGFKWEQFSATLQKDAIKIGDKLLPRITSGLDAVGGWLDSHGDEIATVFGNAADAAAKIGKAIGDTVVPAFQSIIGAFNKLPEPVKQLLIGGFVANKVVKWTFGIDAAGIGKDVLGKILGSAMSKIFAANVTVVGGNVIGGAAGAAGAAGEAAAGGEAVVAGGALGAGVVTVVAAAALAALYKLGSDNQAPGGANINVNSLSGQAQAGFTNAWRAGAAPIVSALDSQRTGKQLDDLLAGLPQYAGKAADDIVQGNAQTWSQAAALFHKTLDPLHRDFVQGMHDLAKAVDPAKIIKAADQVAKDIVKGVGSVKTTEHAIDLLKKAQAKALKDGNTELAKKLGIDIRKVEAKLPGRKWVDHQMRTADQIVASGKTTKEKIKELTSIQAAFTKRGDTHAASIIGGYINSLKPLLRGIWQAIPAIGRGSSNDKGHALGMIAMTSGKTNLGDFGFAGEVKGEAVAVIANPRPLGPGAALSVGGGGGRVDVHVHLHGVATPGAMAQAAREFMPALVREMQRNGILPRVGSPILG